MPRARISFPLSTGAHATRARYATETTCPFRPRHCGLNRTVAPFAAQESLSSVEEQVIWRYVVAGSLWWEEHGTRVQVRPGMAIAKRQPSSGRWWLAEGSVDVLWIILQGSAACSYFHQITQSFGSVHRLQREGEAVRRAVEMVRTARRNAPRSPFFWSNEAYLWLSAWHRELVQHHRPAQTLLAARPEDERLRALAPHRVKNFAAHVGYSVGYLTRVISRSWKQTPGRVLRRVRLEAAARLLRDSREQVATVAATVGYASVPAFITAFKAKFGCTPLHYRRTQV